MTGPLTEQSVVPVELSIGQWQQVLHVLADGQHRIVGPLITQIGQQLQHTIQVQTAAQNAQHTNGTAPVS